MSITLKNQHLTAVIREKGAELCSVTDPAGTEYIWQADPAIWGRHAPLLFPLIGRLKDDSYTLNGKTWHMSRHGFCRDALFTVTAQSETSVSLRLTDSPETLAMWPFAFALTVTFSLQDKSLTKTVQVENRSGERMYYELGCHDGFRAPLEPGQEMRDYAVVVPGLDTMRPYGMNEELLLTHGDLEFALTRGRIHLPPASYGLDTVVLDHLPRRQAHLVDGEGRVRVIMDFADYPYLGIWTTPKPFDTNYVCIEPWSTLPDADFVGRDLSEKQGIRILDADQSESFTTITTFG